jgi:hypothetical protein
MVLVSLLAVAGACGAAYWQGRSDGKNDCEAAAARELRIGKAAADSAASAAAAAIARISVRHTTIRQEAEREIQVRTEYRDCRHSPEQLQRIDAALTGDAAGSAPGGGKLPAADTAGR